MPSQICMTKGYKHKRSDAFNLHAEISDIIYYYLKCSHSIPTSFLFPNA